MSFGVVIAAAGSARRMGAALKKQFLPIGGKPLLLHTIHSLLALRSMVHIEEWVVVTAEEDIRSTDELLRSVSGYPAITVIAGGKERQESVCLGLRALQHSEYVLIHDGARPFVSQGMLALLLEEVRRSGAAVPAVPVKDTIKQIDSEGWITATPPRDSLWAVQTPQAFRLAQILHAHELAEAQGWLATDDASLMELAGHPVRTVMGNWENIKVTTPEDMLLAEAIWEKRRLV